MEDRKPTQAEILRRQQHEQVVKQAIAKQQAGKKLTQAELRAFEKWENEQDERRGSRWVQALPKKFWAKWSGRQHKVLSDQAKLYGIPLDGKTVDVREIAKWLHDFLAKYRQPLSDLVKQESAADGEAKSLQGKKLAEEVKQLKHRNQLLQNKIELDSEQLVNRELIHEQMVRAAQILRNAGDRLYKKCGNEAGDILANAIDDFEILLSELHGQSSQEPAEVD